MLLKNLKDSRVYFSTILSFFTHQFVAIELSTCWDWLLHIVPFSFGLLEYFVYHMRVDFAVTDISECPIHSFATLIGTPAA